MLDILGTRQKDLLALLLRNKPGLTADDISERLGISRNAVRQHLASLENERLVKKGVTCATGGRPKQLYVLTDKGHECFPRHYSWFAELLVASIAEQKGSEGMAQQLSQIGTKIGEQLLARHGHLLSGGADSHKVLTDIMDELGYAARASRDEDGAAVIEADNCVFHDLAVKNPQVCEFDLALMRTFTNSEISHQECMAKNGNVCRFKLTPKKPGS